MSAQKNFIFKFDYNFLHLAYKKSIFTSKYMS